MGARGAMNLFCASPFTLHGCENGLRHSSALTQAASVIRLRHFWPKRRRKDRGKNKDRYDHITTQSSCKCFYLCDVRTTIWSNLLQGITWTLCRTTSVALLDNPSPWPCSSQFSCSSTSRTFLVCVGCHLPPHQSQSPGRRRPETESHLTAEQSDCLIGLIQNCAKITCSFLRGKSTKNI